jgi:hypothetical protein
MPCELGVVATGSFYPFPIIHNNYSLEESGKMDIEAIFTSKCIPCFIAREAIWSLSL